MAKKKTAGAAPTNAGEENVSAYFKNILRARPDLVKERSNDAIFKIWLDDHPGHAEVPKNVQNGLANVKSVMRKNPGAKPKKGGKVRKTYPAPSNNGKPSPASAPKLSTRDLEALEIMIDDSLLLARKIGGAGLTNAIDHLRKARIQVGLKLGL
jgi:hypothetical protein